MFKSQFILMFLLLAFVGCSQTEEQTVAAGEPAEPTQEGSVTDPAPSGFAPAAAPTASGGGGQAVAPKAPAQPAAPTVSVEPPAAAAVQPASAAQPAPEPQPVIVTIPSGTDLAVRLAQRVSSASSRTGEKFEASLDEDLTVNGQVVAKRGSVVTGELTEVVPAGKVKGRARMSLRLSELRAAGQAYPLRTNQLSFEAEGTAKKDALKVGIGAGVGAAIGAIAGGKKGAAIGTAIGGGTGTAAVVMTKGDEVQFDVEQQLQFQLAEDLKVTVQ